MITKSSVKVQKSFKIEFIFNADEMNNFCLVLAHGVSSVFHDKDLEDCVDEFDRSFMISVRDYVLKLRDNGNINGYVD